MRQKGTVAPHKTIFASCVARRRINMFNTFMRGQSPHKRLWIRLCVSDTMRRRKALQQIENSSRQSYKARDFVQVKVYFIRIDKSKVRPGAA